MKRPTRDDPDVLHAAARSLAEAILESKLDELADQLANALDECGDHDGYALGKVLERDGWDVDADLVEILNGASSAIGDAHEDAVEAWVRREAIVPAFVIGDRVLVDHVYADRTLDNVFADRRGRSGVVNVGTVEMTIREVNRGRAQYTVYSLALGHLTDEQETENRRKGGRFTPGTTGLIVDYERVYQPMCQSCGCPNPGGICAVLPWA